MKLFEEKERTRQQPMRRGELLYSFYDECARNGYDEYRSIVNSWLDGFPEPDRRHLVLRMRRGGDGEFRSALTELIAHATLRGLGLDLSVHPSLPETSRRPDFAIVDNGSVGGSLRSRLSMRLNQQRIKRIGKR